MYKAGHSTESALLKIHDDVSRALDKGKGVLMLFLDFSAAFNTINQTKLLNILRSRCGFRVQALHWFKYYLTDRSQRVLINNM